MKYIKIMWFMVVCLLSVSDVQSYAGKNDSMAKTGVYVHGDENINSLIEGYISKELKNLGNVIVTYTKLDCAIDIIAKEITTTSGTTGRGYAISVTIVERFDCFPLATVIKELDSIIPEIKAQPIVIKQLEKLSEELVGIAINTSKVKSYHNSFLYTGGEDQLRKLCSEIVSDFNNEYLKEKMKLIQRKY